MMFEFWFLLAVRASHPHLRIPSSRAHLHLRTSCLNDFAQFVRRPIAYTPNTEVLGALVLLRPHSPYPHGHPRLFVQLLAAMGFSVYPSVIHFAPKSAKRFPTGGTSLAALHVTLHTGFAVSPFRPAW